MANWTPEERNDGGVILGWYEIGDDADQAFYTDTGGKITELRDRTPNGNHLTGSVSYDSNELYEYIIFGNSGEYLSHNSPYMLGTDPQQVHSESMTYITVTRHPVNDQTRYFFSESSTLDSTVFKPMQIGGTAGGTTADDLTYSLTDKSGVNQAELNAIGDVGMGTANNRVVHSAQFSQAKNSPTAAVNGSRNGLWGSAITDFVTGNRIHTGLELRDQGKSYWYPNNENWQGSGDRFTIGGVTNSGGTTVQTSTFHFYALIIVRDCTKNLRQLIEQYFMWKYGLDADIQPGNPGSGSQVQADPETDPLYSLVRSYNQFKGAPGQLWSDDAILGEGFQFGYADGDTQKNAYWYFDFYDYPYEWSEAEAVAAGKDERDSISYWNKLGLKSYQLPGQSYEISKNNDQFPFRYYGDVERPGLWGRPLKSGMSSWWQGVKEGRVLFPFYPEYPSGAGEGLLREDGQFIFTDDRVAMPRTNEFCIEFTMMILPALGIAGSNYAFNLGYVNTQFGTDGAAITLGFDITSRRIYLLNRMGYESSGDVYGVNYITYTHPANEHFYIPFDICIQRQNKKLELWVNGVLVGSADAPLPTGAIEREDYDIQNTYLWVNDENRPEYQSGQGDTIPTVGHGFRFGQDSGSKVATIFRDGIYTDVNERSGCFAIDDFRYTATARYNQTYNPSSSVFSPVLPFFSTQPQDVYTYEGSNVTLTSVATTSQGSITYQWYNANTGALIPGATGANLSLFNVPFVYPYAAYYNIADNGQAKARSATATVYANPATITGIARAPGLPDAPQAVGQNTRVVHAEVPGLPSEPTTFVVQTITGTGPFPSPLEPPRVVATVEYDNAQAVGDNYLGELIDADGNVTTVPISSWQATLSSSNKNYAQMVVPNAAPFNEALSSAVEFRVIRVRTIQGLEARLTMAQCEANTVTNSRGISKNTSTVSGYSDPYGDELATTSVRELQGVRSFSSGGTGMRIRCDIDELVKPGRRVTWLTDADFIVGFVNLYVNGSQAYMDVGD